MNGEEINFIKSLSHTNDPRFVKLKAAEECGELSVKLIQSVTKPESISLIDILSEIADVEIQLIALKELLNIEEVEALKSMKVEKLKEYKKNIINFGQI